MDQKKKPQGLTYEKLYQSQSIPPTWWQWILSKIIGKPTPSSPNIWFLAWVLKQRQCNPDFNQQILSVPFFIERDYWSNGQLHYLRSYKNGKWHGLDRLWDRNGQLRCETEWQNGQRDGLSRGWYPNGQLQWEEDWQNGQKNRFSLG